MSKTSACTPRNPYSETRDEVESPKRWIHREYEVIEKSEGDFQRGMSAYERRKCKTCGQTFKVITG